MDDSEYQRRLAALLLLEFLLEERSRRQHIATVESDTVDSQPKPDTASGNQPDSPADKNAKNDK